MWFWLIQAIAGSILGNATASWFKNTSVGKWFYKKVEQIYNRSHDFFSISGNPRMKFFEVRRQMEKEISQHRKKSRRTRITN